MKIVLLLLSILAGFIIAIAFKYHLSDRYIIMAIILGVLLLCAYLLNKTK